MKKAQFTMVLLAAFAAGGIVQYLAQSAHAQGAPAAEVRAQRFVLVDERGVAAGAFVVSPPAARTVGPSRSGAPSIVLLDNQGREIWRPSGSGLLPLGNH